MSFSRLAVFKAAGDRMLSGGSSTASGVPQLAHNADRRGLEFGKCETEPVEFLLVRFWPRKAAQTNYR